MSRLSRAKGQLLIREHGRTRKIKRPSSHEGPLRVWPKGGVETSSKWGTTTCCNRWPIWF